MDLTEGNEALKAKVLAAAAAIPSLLTGTAVLGATPAHANYTDIFAGGNCAATSSIYKTSTDGGRANGKMHVFCNRNYSRVYASTLLYRDRWYGPQRLDDDTSEVFNDNTVDSISIYRCAGQGTYTYEVRSAFAVTGDGGDHTYRGVRFSC